MQALGYLRQLIKRSALIGLARRPGLLLCLLCYLSPIAAAKLQASSTQSLHVAVYIDGAQHRRQVESLFRRFNEHHSDIELTTAVHRGIDSYANKVEKWMSTGAGPDLVYWYGGKRIAQFAELGKITDLQDFWQRHELDNYITSASKQAVNFRGRAHAIPAATLLWALHYNKQQLEQWQLEPPETWQDLLRSCKILRARGIDALAFGSRTQWSTHAWFDYINLRLHGLDFYQQLLDGNISFTDARVLSSLEHWKQLLDAECFNQNHANLTIWESFPRVVLGKSAFSLCEGLPQFVRLPPGIDIEVSNFPRINDKHPLYTVHPTNVFMVPSYVSWSPALETLLLYIASEEFQRAFSSTLVRVPAHTGAVRGQNKVNTEVAKLFYASPGGIQFLDRDSDIRFSSETPKIFVNFMQHRNVKQTAAELEDLRTNVFGPLEKHPQTSKPKQNPTKHQS